MRSYDENREEVIKRSRDIQKLSKQVAALGVALGVAAPREWSSPRATPPKPTHTPAL